MGTYKSKTWGRCKICDFSFDTRSEYHNGLEVNDEHWWDNFGNICCQGCTTSVDYSDLDNLVIAETNFIEAEQIEMKNLIDDDFDER